MGYSWLQFIQLLGSVALFIFGMKVMSDGIQKSAGSRFRSAVNTITANKYYGLLTGMLATFLLQSSSITTVIVVGLANSGILSLFQSISVMLGANIGTTITAWLLTIVEFSGFDSKIVSLGMIFIGVIMLFSKKEQYVFNGEVIVGVGLLFLGIQSMQAYTPDLQSNPDVLRFLKDYEFENTTFFNRLLYLLMFVGIGAVVAIIVQSSTAAVAITLVMTAKGWIPLPFAMALVLGENIGTTVTANVAALIGNVQAKRAALSHFLLNAFGIVWALVFFNLLLHFTVKLTVAFSGQDPMENTNVIPVALSFFHTLFNVINVGIFLFAIPSLANITKRIFPANDFNNGSVLSNELFNSAQATAPLMAILRVKKEIHSMVKISQRAYQLLPKILLEGEEVVAKEKLEKIRRLESTTDEMEVNMLQFLTKVSEQKLAPSLSREIRDLMSSINYMERCTDLILKSSYNLIGQKQKKAFFTPQQRNNVLNMMSAVGKAFDNLEEGFLLERFDLKKAESLENTVNETFLSLREDYLKKIESGKFTIQSGLFYMDVLSELERMADHLYNVVVTMSAQNQ